MRFPAAHNPHHLVLFSAASAGNVKVIAGDDPKTATEGSDGGDAITMAYRRRGDGCPSLKATAGSSPWGKRKTASAAKDNAEHFL